MKVAQMTKDEFEDFVSTLERKLDEILGDPDKGLPLRKKVRDQLVRQKRAVAKGERGKSLI